MVEDTIREDKGMATDKNGFRIEFKWKNPNVWLGEIEVVVLANKMACPQMEK
jgi:hypothetical protein